MLNLGIRCTCIIQRHIQSWFEAVLAILQSWDQTWHACRCPKVVQKGQNDPNWSHDFGHLESFMDHLESWIISEKKLDILPQSTKRFLAKVLWSKNQVLSEMVLKFPNGPKMFPNVQKRVMLIIWDNFVPFYILGHRQACHVWPFLVLKDPPAPPPPQTWLKDGNGQNCFKPTS